MTFQKTYSIEINKGLCYYCNKEKSNLKNIVLSNQYTINYCKECEHINHNNLDTIKKNENYYTTYKVIYKNEIRYITIKEYRKVGFIEILQLFNKKR